MTTEVHAPKVLILLVTACLVWAGLIFLAYLILKGIPFSTSWIAGGAVISATLAWLLVMFREIHDSYDRTDNGQVDPALTARKIPVSKAHR